MSWQPQQQGLEEVLSMLRSSSSGDSEVQKAVAKVRPPFFLFKDHDHPSTRHVLLAVIKFNTTGTTSIAQSMISEPSGPGSSLINIASRRTKKQPRFPRIPRARPDPSAKRTGLAPSRSRSLAQKLDSVTRWLEKQQHGCRETGFGICQEHDPGGTSGQGSNDPSDSWSRHYVPTRL